MTSNNYSLLRAATLRAILASTFFACIFAMPAWSRAQTEPPPAELQAPISVYNNWSSYDELSDNVRLTETLAMRELDELIRFDYYTMDAFWFAPDGGYRTWRKADWPNGPDAWIKKCQENGIKPGMWFETNSLVQLKAVPAWKDSLNKGGWAMSLSEGGFLPDFMDVLQYWYDHGVRMFKFDFANMNAATPADEAAHLSKAEIKERNVDALREALFKFRTKNPDAVLLAFNGFGCSPSCAAFCSSRCPSKILPICVGFRPSKSSTPATRGRATYLKPAFGAQWISTATTRCAALSRVVFHSNASTRPVS